MRLTRQLISKLTPVSKTHDTPPSPARIAQAKAERSLIDLVAALRTPGVSAESTIHALASRMARLDTTGAKDVGSDISVYSGVLGNIAGAAETFSNTYADKCDAGAGASLGETVPHPDYATLPPAVTEQIALRVERDSAYSKVLKQSLRGSDTFIQAGEKADRMMRDRDNELPHTIIGPGGDFDKPLYA